MKRILAWIVFVQSITTIAFSFCSTSTTRLSLFARFSMTSDDFEGIHIIGESHGDEGGGRQLAREFEQELKARNELVKKEMESQSNRRLLSQDESRIIQQRAFSRRVVLPSTSTSAGFFSGRGQRVYSFPLEPNNPPTQPEYSLANTNNNTPVLSILVALALLSIYMAVGLTGDVSDTMQDWNARMVGDAVSEHVERVLPSAKVEPVVVVPSVYL